MARTIHEFDEHSDDSGDILFNVESKQDIDPGFESDSNYGIVGNFFWMQASIAGYMSLMVPLVLLTPVQCAVLTLGVMAVNQFLFSYSVQSQVNDKQCMLINCDNLPEKDDMEFDQAYFKRKFGDVYIYAYKVGDRFFTGQVELSQEEKNGLLSGPAKMVGIKNSLLTKINYNQMVSRMCYNYAATSWQDGALCGLIFSIGLKSLLVTSVLFFAPITWYLSTGITLLLVSKLVLCFVAPFLGCMLASSELSKKASASEENAVKGMEAVSEAYPQKYSICGRVLGLFALNNSSVEQKGDESVQGSRTALV